MKELKRVSVSKASKEFHTYELKRLSVSKASKEFHLRPMCEKKSVRCPLSNLSSTDLRKAKEALIPRYSMVLHIALLTFKDKIRI